MAYLKVSDARVALRTRVEQELRAQTTNNEVLSRDEQAQLPSDLKRAADFVRDAKGPGARISVNDVVDSYMTYVDTVLHAVNTRGEVFLSRDEQARIYDGSLQARLEAIRVGLAAVQGASLEVDSATKNMAASFVLANVEPSASQTTGKLFPSLDSGNEGLRAGVVVGDQAARFAELAKRLDGQLNLPTFDANLHAVVLVRSTSHDDQFYINVVEKSSGAPLGTATFSPVGLVFSLDKPTFERLVAPLSVIGAASYDYREIDGEKVCEQLFLPAAKLNIENPYDNFSAAKRAAISTTLANVLNDFDLPNLNVAFFPAMWHRQSKLENNTVSIDTALRESLNSFLNDASDPESPLGILRENVANDLGANASDAEILAEAKVRLRALVASPDTEFRFLSLEERAEYGETTTANWIASLSIPSLSDHGHWAVVDRTGQAQTYNYGFN